MGFSAPKPPKAPPPPPTTISPELIERRRRARSKTRSARKQTLLTSPLGITSRGTISVPSLIGGMPGLSKGV